MRMRQRIWLARNSKVFIKLFSDGFANGKQLLDFPGLVLKNMNKIS